MMGNVDEILKWWWDGKQGMVGQWQWRLYACWCGKDRASDMILGSNLLWHTFSTQKAYPKS